MSTRHSELRLQGTLEPAFLPLNWKIQTGIHIKPIPADLLLLAPGLAVERDGAGLSPHIVGIFEYLGQAQYPQERREVLRGNLLKGYLQLIAKFVDQHFYIAALMDGLLKFFLHVIQRGLRVGGGLVLAVCFPDVPDDAVQRKVFSFSGTGKSCPEHLELQNRSLWCKRQCMRRLWCCSDSL